MVYTEFTWVLACSAVLAVFVAYGIGANDVANAFGSSVGAKALTMKQAILAAAFFEFLGAVLMGAGVTNTIRSDIAKLSYYTNSPDLLMYGMMCALLAAGLWLLLATYWELPVSTTHSIVGAIVGMSMVAAGVDSVQWSAKSTSFPYLKGMSAIVLSWVFSPILSGVAAAVLFLFTRHAVLRSKDSYKRSILLFPFYAFLTFWIIPFFIMKKGGQAFNWQNISAGKAAWISTIIAACCAIFAATVGVWWVKKLVQRDVDDQEKSSISTAEDGKIQGNTTAAAAAALDDEPAGVATLGDAEDDFLTVPKPGAAPSHTPTMLTSMRKSKVWGALTASANTDIHAIIEEDAKIQDIHAHSEVFDPKSEVAFKYLQVCTACANSFAHGSNDVANAMGPFAAIYGIWLCTCVTSKSTVPVWILVMGGAGIVLGLATYGYKIMRVLGVKMTRLTNSRGYCVELAAAATVILGSYYGLPLSTTHCMVGAVTAIGMLEGSKGFNYKLLFKFFAGWVATLVVAALTAAAFTAQGVYSPNKEMSDERSNLLAAATPPPPGVVGI